MARAASLAAMVAAAAPAIAGADEPPEEIVVVESRIDEPAYRVGTQVSVDASELAGIEPANVEQLLERLPGVSLNRPGGPGGVSEVFLRGAESNFTAVYIDDVRVNDSANTRGGSFDFSSLASAGIARVDVAMGAMSAIYGSDAMAGVIRIDTLWPDAGQRLVHAEAGSHGAWRAGAAATMELAESAALGFRLAALDGGNAVDGSSHELASAASRLSGAWRGGERWQIDVRHAARDRTSYPEVSGGPRLAVLDELETAEGTHSSLSARTGFALSPRWRAEIVASHVEIADEIVTPAVPAGELDGQPAFTADSEYRRSELLWVNRLDTGGNVDLAFGLDIVDERGQDDGAIDFGVIVPTSYRLDRTVTSAFGEIGRSWPAGIAANLALRADHFGDDTRFTGKLGLSRDFGAAGARLWARIANGFKLPSFFALGNALVGNPDLVEEKVRNVELGWEQSLPGGADLSLSLFSSRYEDLVDFDFETFTNVNRGRIDIEGATLRLGLPLSNRVHVGVDATVSDISSASGPLRRRPEETGGIELQWELPASFHLNASIRYVGERLVTSIPTGDVVDGSYVTGDLTLTQRLSTSLSWWFAVDNALDADYEDAPGFPAPGIAARIGIRIAL